MELLPFVILLCLFSGSHGEQYVDYIIRLVVNRSCYSGELWTFYMASHTPHPALNKNKHKLITLLDR